MAFVALTSLMETIRLEFLQSAPRVSLDAEKLSYFQAFLRHLSHFQAFLHKPCGGSAPTIKNLETKIRDFAFKAEDDIETQLHTLLLAKDDPESREKACWALHQAVQEATQNAVELFKIINSTSSEASGSENLQLWDGSWCCSLEKVHAMEEEDNLPNSIKKRLTEGSNQLIVISVVGFPGLGKTTLVKKLFLNRELRYKFPTRLWVYVSSDMSRRQIFMDIISQFTMQTHYYKDISEEHLAERINEFLRDEKYLIVLDDVWSGKDFDYLKIAFPNNQKGSRILVTTSDLEVARHVDSNADPFQFRLLNFEESWDLLRMKVFGNETCPSVLEPIGKRIAMKCNGLPLAVMVIAGVLDKNSPVARWKEVDENPFPVINPENQSYNSLVKMSYNELPNHTKDCLLYLATLFPIGHEIFASKLIHLWIAEGFIPSSPNMEGIAEAYLEDFANRNLLVVVKRRVDGKIKTCRLHNQMHEFCSNEALRNNLFQEIDGRRIEGNENNNYRRLCICFSLRDFIGSKLMPSGEHIRSLLLTYSSTHLKIPKQHLAPLAAIPKYCPLLRVFDAESLTLEIVPKELYHLYHLRYLAISTHNNIIPKLFTHLWNLQTLVFNTSQSRVDVKAEIWNMPKLRHILANASLQFPPAPSHNYSSSSSSSSCPELQTLSTISPKSCSAEMFEKTPNLVKLGVRGNVAELLECKELGGICLFDNIRKLEKLENLKLMHEEAAAASTSRPIIIPQANKFPRKLRKLTLSKTCFDWKDICVLGSLDELEVLKLEEFAAKGECWELNNVNNVVVFKRLQFLRIGRTDLVHWTCDKSSFPVLKRLYISQCENLKEVPLSFKDVKSLRSIELFYTNKQAATSALKIRDQRDNNEEYYGLALCIFPPDH